ncbi:unnamed protein product [Adineta ricciae]|uniref:Autocrine proliferation repressor A-like n=1 Tax=Adineta ricciae TaxID=249248 RepID=A0A815M1D8_ADIRI|nr:unnamed protein product [Adineta ricciae]
MYHREFSSPLDDYVHAPDPYMNWTVLKIYDMPDYVLYILNFTSQKWLDETFSNRPMWSHYLCISVPNKLTRPKSAFMFIDGGHFYDGLPKPEDNFVALTSMFAVSSGSIGVDLQDIANQPIRFNADLSNKSRSEDSLLGWTWKAYLENQSNPNVLLHMPVTKACVRAMDAVQQFLGQLKVIVPESFIIGGASKHGWATWTTAAVDHQRVIAAIPIVMNTINFQMSLHHHYRSLVGWTFAFQDYYDLGITRYVDSTNLAKMSQIIDPYNYFDRFANKKLLLLQTAGDEFFLLDGEYTFWGALQDATNHSSFLRRLPNAEHSCAGHEISLFLTMRSFYLSVYDDKPLPSFKWTKNMNNTHGYIRATADFGVGPKPMSAIGYRARTLNADRRDFRLLIANPNDTRKPIVNPVLWLTTSLVTEETTPTSITYSLTIENPMSGWEGFYIQVSFPGPDGSMLELTTETQIIPDTYPTGDCHGDQCYGTIV